MLAMDLEQQLQLEFTGLQMPIAHGHQMLCRVMSAATPGVLHTRTPFLHVYTGTHVGTMPCLWLL